MLRVILTKPTSIKDGFSFSCLIMEETEKEKNVVGYFSGFRVAKGKINPAANKSGNFYYKNTLFSGSIGKKIYEQIKLKNWESEYNFELLDEEKAIAQLKPNKFELEPFIESINSTYTQKIEVEHED